MFETHNADLFRTQTTFSPSCPIVRRAMRKIIAYCFLGLAAVSTAAGCGLLREARSGKSGDNCCANGKCTSENCPANAPGRPVIKDKALPTSRDASEPIKRLPDTNPMEKRGTLPIINK